MLAERLEFFMPKLMDVMKAWQWLLYVFFWSIFVTVTHRYEIATWADFLMQLSSRLLQNTLSIIPSLYIIDYLRHIFKSMSIPKVTVYVVSILMTTYAISMTLISLIMINMGWIEYNPRTFIPDILVDTVSAGGFALIFLLYFLRRYREMNALKQSFEHKLSAQNDIIKARLSPHFFFNTLNTLVSLIETNPPRAAALLQNVSALFRASFNGAREISFEEEIALCEHYLAIEASRLADKLEVTWDLPDEDVMYDMVINALTLQSILERMLLNVVEMTTEIICINIKVTWQQHQVMIVIGVDLPKKTLIINHDLRQNMSFYIQAERLRSYFGQSADIKSTVTNTQIITVIDYPLQDVSL